MRTRAFLLLFLLATAVPFASSSQCDFYVSLQGSDAGDGSAELPFRTPAKAVAVAGSVPQSDCRGGVRTIRFASADVFELEEPLELNASHTRLAFAPTATNGSSPLPVLSAGRRLSSLSWETTRRSGLTLWRCDITNITAGKPANRIFTLYVGSSRRQRIRTPLLHWEQSIDTKNQSSLRNHDGFVYGTDTFDPSWSLSENATSQWLIVAFHQWATDVHTVQGVFPTNRTLLVNEPTYYKYGFDDNVYGAKRFYIENVPELELVPGQWRVVDSDDHRFLEYAPLPEDPSSPSDADITLPLLTSVFNMSGASNVTIENISFGFTEFELEQTSQMHSWRARVESITARNMPNEDLAEAFLPVRGSGPLPVTTAIVQASDANGLRISGCVVGPGGADGVVVSHSADVTLERSQFSDFGGSAISAAVADRLNVSENYLSLAGRLWQQGIGVSVGVTTGATVSRNAFWGMASDGTMFGTIQGCSLVNNTMSDFGGAIRDVEETICDWGGVHTAMPNISTSTLQVTGNTFRNFSSYGIGGYSLYFDYGSTGVNASQNMAVDTGSGIFWNSNGEFGNTPGTWGNVSNNVIVFTHSEAGDMNNLIKWRTLLPSLAVERNIFVARIPTPALSEGFTLFVDHTSSQPQQFDGQRFDYNMYYNFNVSDADFGSTWPHTLSWHAWQATGQDSHSVVGTNPNFVDPDNGDFTVPDSSPACALGFRPWDYSTAGPSWRPTNLVCQHFTDNLRRPKGSSVTVA